MVEVSLDLDEEICKMLKEISEWDKKSENEFLSEMIEKNYSQIKDNVEQDNC